LPLWTGFKSSMHPPKTALLECPERYRIRKIESIALRAVQSSRFNSLLVLPHTPGGGRRN
jgi:hypothetical protein